MDAAAFKTDEQYGGEAYRTLVELSTDGLMVLSPQAGVMYISPSYARILGYTLEDFAHIHPFSVIHPEDFTEAEAYFAAVIRGEEPANPVEFRAYHKNGSLRIIEGVGKRMPDGNLAGFIRDITARKQAEEALRRLNAELEQRVAERTAEQLRLAAIVEATSDYVGVADLEGWSLYVNKNGRRMIGKPEEPDGKPWHVSACHPSEEGEKLQEMFRTCLQGETWSGETRLRHLEGRDIPVSMVAVPLRDMNGNIEAIAAIMRDITEIKQFADELKAAKEAAEAALAESQRLTMIIESSPDLVGIAGMDGRYTYLNSTARSKLGLAEDADISQVTLQDIFTPESMEIISGTAIPAAYEHGSWAGELVTVPVEGEPFPVHLVGIIHRDETGTPIFMSGVSRDISERKRFEEELRQAKEAAEAANRAKSTFLANMSHEIRTPMNAIIGMTSLLLDMELNGKQREFVEIIRTSGDTLLTVINDILDFSKIEADKLEVVSRPFNLHDCVESALDLLAPRVAEKRLDLVYMLDEHTPRAIVSDVTRLRQILVNLLSNAVKFTESGEVVVCVTGSKREEGDYELHFSVRDTGIGIPEDRMNRLFKSFSQVDASTTREYGGTGLGLVISKRLSEMLGGTMWVESEGISGRGATFHFTIVAAAAPAPDRSHLQTPQPRLSGRRVLVVDDNATNRRILSLQLQTWGMVVVEAPLPGAALAMLEQGESFDLALLDMYMPQMDGQQLAAALRKLPTGRSLPLVMLTSLSQQNISPDIFAAFLTKPIKPSELFNILMNLFAGEEHRAPHSGTMLQAADTPLAEQMPLRILLAEDVVVNQKFAIHVLEQMGYRVDIAANGLEVLEAVARQRYDVILMDVQMPEMDGLEATRRIRRLFIPQPHIIAITANAMQGDREICIEAGMDDYISKPIYLAELRAALRRAGQRIQRGSMLRNGSSEKNFRQELMLAFAGEGPGILDKMREAVERGDAAGIRATAHQLKGSSAYIGAKALPVLCAELERQAGGSPDRVNSLYKQVEAAFVAVLEDFAS